mmetsp:Transcript_46578/g.108746  ORF Transcript_46578/g.108746 Transcript_46578/m.108746 type:complete len:245 (+) Transcript_46578:205-939(+)
MPHLWIPAPTPAGGTRSWGDSADTGRSEWWADATSFWGAASEQSLGLPLTPAQTLGGGGGKFPAPPRFAQPPDPSPNARSRAAGLSGAFASALTADTAQPTRAQQADSDGGSSSDGNAPFQPPPRIPQPPPAAAKPRSSDSDSGSGSDNEPKQPPPPPAAKPPPAARPPPGSDSGSRSDSGSEPTRPPPPVPRPPPAKPPPGSDSDSGSDSGSDKAPPPPAPRPSPAAKTPGSDSDSGSDSEPK